MDDNSESEVEIVQEDDNERAGNCKRGREASPFWEIAFGGADAKKAKNINCSHCGDVVKHNGKSERIGTHLGKCVPYINKVRRAQNNAAGVVPDNLKLKEIKVLKQQSALSFAVPALSAQDQGRFDELFALFMYNTGTSFQRAEDPFLKAALEILRPNVIIPKRKRLAEELLNSAHDKLKLRIRQQNVVSVGVISCDSSEDVNKRSITNSNFITGGKDIFIETRYEGEFSHDAEYIKEEFSKNKEDLEDQGG